MPILDPTCSAITRPLAGKLKFDDWIRGTHSMHPRINRPAVLLIFRYRDDRPHWGSVDEFCAHVAECEGPEADPSWGWIELMFWEAYTKHLRKLPPVTCDDTAAAKPTKFPRLQTRDALPRSLWDVVDLESV